MLYISYVIRHPQLPEGLYDHLIKIYQPVQLTLGKHIHGKNQNPHWHINMSYSEETQIAPSLRGKNRCRITKPFSVKKQDITSQELKKNETTDVTAWFSYPMKEYELDSDIQFAQSIGFENEQLCAMRLQANAIWKFANRARAIKEANLNEFFTTTAECFSYIDENYKNKSKEILDLDTKTDLYKLKYHVIGALACEFYMNVKKENPPDKVSELALQYMRKHEMITPTQMWRIKNKYKII